MKRVLSLVLLLTLLAGGGSFFAPQPAQAQSLPPVPPGCNVITPNIVNGIPEPPFWLVCIPPGPPATPVSWNGDMVVFAHGFVAPGPITDFANLSMGSINLPALVMAQGYGFATTTYPKNGLAVLEGAQDVANLIQALPTILHQPVNHTFLTGASEGGLVTALLAQENPGNRITGALAACGPVGSFRRQVNYFGDFRVLFDFFYPGVLPQSPVSIPPELMSNWYQPGGGNEQVAAALTGSPFGPHLVATAGAAIDPAHPQATIIQTAQEVLWYNVFATNDAVVELGGQPYNNRTPFKLYVDPLSIQVTYKLNRPYAQGGVQRFSADPAALASLTAYETTGKLKAPIVTLHTTLDDVIPFWQEAAYAAKLAQQGNLGKALLIPIPRYGHCQFTQDELLLAFDAMVTMSTGGFFGNVKQHLNADQVRKDFEREKKQFEPK